MKYLCIHESGVKRGFFSQLRGVNNYHRDLWNSKSSLGFYVGYNEFVDIDGKRTKTRAEGEETMAVIGHNQDGTYHVCFALDGDKQSFNDKQKQVYLEIREEHSEKTLTLHKSIQKNRTCPGGYISLFYLEGLTRLKETTEDERKKLLRQYVTLLGVLEKLYKKLLALIK